MKLHIIDEAERCLKCKKPTLSARVSDSYTYPTNHSIIT